MSRLHSWNYCRIQWKYYIRTIFTINGTGVCGVCIKNDISKLRTRNMSSLKDVKTAKLAPGSFYKQLAGHGVEFFCGVPDSLLKALCAFIMSSVSPAKHIITANEGSAVGLATGYHLATGKVGVVYMQNSGLGNTVNPLLSLAVPDVYSVPMLLLIGWRGEPGVKDEPQHNVMGQVSQALLDAIRVPYSVLPQNEKAVEEVLNEAFTYINHTKGPYALLIKKDTFESYGLPSEKATFPMSRESALRTILEHVSESDIVVSTTGMLSRELFEMRKARGQGHDKDFLTVGSMGHASSIALGLALNCPTGRQVFCLDGDGAVIMHMGTLATVGQRPVTNLKHVIINNGAHDSVGGQPTDAANHNRFSFSQIALGCGYKESFVAATEADLVSAVKRLRTVEGPCVLEVKVCKGARKDLGRPTRTPIENKNDFMSFVRGH